MPEVVGISGGGIAGLALAIALQNHGIHSIIYEKDESWGSRQQGYGLTIQQGGRALKSLGILETIKTRTQSSSTHFIFDSNGKPVIWWGTPHGDMDSSKWMEGKTGKRNVHISRQNLRDLLLSQINPSFVTIKWNSPVFSFSQTANKVQVCVESGVVQDVDVLVGCDGIYSKIRTQLLPNDKLIYLDTFVMLGIFEKEPFPLLSLQNRVVQMSNGNTRIFMMPFDESRYMWQLSFPIESHEKALALSKSGQASLRAEAMKRCGTFHAPIPDILDHTPLEMITGYPVYDRDPLPDSFSPSPSCLVTLIGDAAHPMSPFKGQGANQALLDAINLADYISKASSLEKSTAQLLREHEALMSTRTRSKVLGSREGVRQMHCTGFVETSSQMERRQFVSEMDLALIPRLEKMRLDGIDISTPEKLDKYAFDL